MKEIRSRRDHVIKSLRTETTRCKSSQILKLEKVLHQVIKEKKIEPKKIKAAKIKTEEDTFKIFEQKYPKC